MGKVKFTMAVAEVRNKVGDVVYARNRYGAYTRNYVVPTDPNTSYQADVRADWGDISESWKTITDAQRIQWIQAANRINRTDIFGNKSKYTGLQLYIKLNMSRKTLGLAQMTTPTAIGRIPIWGNVVLSWTPGATPLSVAVDDANLNSSYSGVIKATDSLSQGVYYFKNKLSIIQVLANASNFPLNISAAWVAKYGAFVSGTRVGVEVSIINRLSGIQSVPIQAYIDVP